MDEIKTDLWNSMLDADMNVRYWSKIARRYTDRDKWSKILVAITTSGSLASLQIWKFTSGGFQWSLIYDMFIIVALVLAVALPFLEYSKTIQNATKLAVSWVELLDRYEALWRKQSHTTYTPEALNSEFSNIKDSEKQYKETELALPRDKKLIRECQEEVKRSRGLI